MVNLRKSAFVFGALAAVCAAGSASAATIDLTYQSVNPGMTESVSTDSGNNYTDYSVGQINFAVSNNVGAGFLPSSGSINTFCIELTGGVTGPNNTFTVLGPGTGSFVAPISPTLGNTLTAFFNQYYTGSLNSTELGAFQLGIWDLIMDTSPGSVSAGTFQVKGNDALVQQANLWLGGFNPNTPTGAWTLAQLHSDSLQDQIIQVPGTGAPPNPTPLPAALPGGLALIVGVAAFGKLRRRKPIAV